MDVHCVTRWSKLDTVWRGVSVDMLLDQVGQVPVSRLWHAVPCFPSISEVWLRLLEAYQD